MDDDHDYDDDEVILHCDTATEGCVSNDFFWHSLDDSPTSIGRSTWASDYQDIFYHFFYLRQVTSSGQSLRTILCKLWFQKSQQRDREKLAIEVTVSTTLLPRSTISTVCTCAITQGRSSSSLSNGVPLRNTSMATSRSVSSVAPTIWNSLPNHFRPLQFFLLLEEVSHTICLVCFSWQFPDWWHHAIRTYHASWYNTCYCHRTTKKYHTVQLNAFHLSAYDQPKWFNPHIVYKLVHG